MISKDPVDVIHEADALEAYLDGIFEAENLTFEGWVGKFGEGFYRDRNELIVQLATPLRPRKVLEFACAGGFLAKTLLERVSSIEMYLCSNFSARMVDYCQRQLEGDPRCVVELLDADVTRGSDFTRERLSAYDLFLTTSFEHIQFDRRFIESLPREAAFIFSVAGFDDPEHFRVFESGDEIRRRYDDLLHFIDVRSTADSTKWIAATRRR